MIKHKIKNADKNNTAVVSVVFVRQRHILYSFVPIGLLVCSAQTKILNKQGFSV